MGLIGLFLIGAVLAIGSVYTLWLCWTVRREFGTRLQEAREAGTKVPASVWVQQTSTIFIAGVFLFVAGSLGYSILRSHLVSETVTDLKIVAEGGGNGGGITWGESGNRGILHVSPGGQQVTGASLCYIHFDNDDLKRVVAEYPQIRWFLLSGTQIDDQAMRLLAERENLDSLVLTDTSISDRGVAMLKGHAQLQELDLAGTMITDQCLEVLLSLPKLQHLNLCRTSITDEGFEVVKGMPLRSLNLQGTDLSDAAVVTVASFRRLERLDILNSEFSAAGIARLQAALPGCTIIREHQEVPRCDPTDHAVAESSLASGYPRP